MRRHTTMGTALLVGSALFGAARAVPDTQRTMRELVAGQADAAVGLLEATNRQTSPESIRLARVAGLGSGLEVWRADLALDHSHPYLLAAASGSVFMLGGFEAPELARAVEAIPERRLDSGGAAKLARELALMADAYGAVQYVFPSRSDDVPGYVSKVAEVWRRRAPARWSPDTVLGRPAGGWHVSVTVISRATKTYTLHWQPVAYSFEFTENGHLLGWAKRSAEPFGVQGVPLPGAANGVDGHKEP